MAAHMSNSNGKHINKSQAIREMLLQNPEATPREIVAALAQQKIKVSSSMIYMVKGRLTQMKHHKDRKAEQVSNAGEKTGSADPIALILKVKQLAKEAGGMRNLQWLVTVLAD